MEVQGSQGLPDSTTCSSLSKRANAPIACPAAQWEIPDTHHIVLLASCTANKPPTAGSQIRPKRPCGFLLRLLLSAASGQAIHLPQELTRTVVFPKLALVPVASLQETCLLQTKSLPSWPCRIKPVFKHLQGWFPCWMFSH